MPSHDAHPVAASPATTKGDILVYDGDKSVRVPVGANDQVLTADSVQAAGVKWGVSAAGAPTGAQYLVLAAHASLTDERVFTPGAGITVVDGGAGGAYTVSVNASNITAGTLPVARGGTGTGTAFTAGSVVFAGASGVYAQDNANLFWDDTNNRLGVGTAAPATALDVVGIVTITKNQDAGSGVSIINTSAGSNAAVSVTLQGEAFKTGAFRITPSAAAGIRSDTVSLESGSTSGSLLLMTQSLNHIIFAVNSVEVARILNDEIRITSSAFIFTGSNTAAGSFTLRATSSGTDGAIIFQTDPTTERERILATGDHLFGRTTSLIGARVEIEEASDSIVMMLRSTGATTADLRMGGSTTTFGTNEAILRASLSLFQVLFGSSATPNLNVSGANARVTINHDTGDPFGEGTLSIAAGATNGIVIGNTGFTSSKMRIGLIGNTDVVGVGTNEHLDAGGQDDATKSSWQMIFRTSASTDKWEIMRRPAGGARDIFLTVNSTGTLIVGGSGNDQIVRPSTAGGGSCGTDALRWGTVYGVDANFTGTVRIGGATAGPALAVLQTAVAGVGANQALRVQAGAHTGTTAGQEVVDVEFALDRTTQFSVATIGTQRAVVVRAPTYAGTAAMTIASASTMNIVAAPMAGTNVTIANVWAFWIEAGRALLDGGLLVGAEPVGLAGKVGYSNTVDNTANSTGVGTILFKGATVRNSSGFLKILDGTTARFIPYFDAITG